MALLEAIVALAVLVTAGSAAAALLARTGESVRAARAVEARAARASAFMEVVSLWPREDLDRRLGDRAQGPWRLRITRVSPTLYRVALADGEGGTPLLETAVYRPLPLAEGR